MVRRLVRWAKNQIELWRPYRDLRRPAFPVNSELEARADAIRFRDKLGDPKADRSRRLAAATMEDEVRAPRHRSDWSFDANGSPIE